MTIWRGATPGSSAKLNDGGHDRFYVHIRIPVSPSLDTINLTTHGLSVKLRCGVMGLVNDHLEGCWVREDCEKQR